MNHQYVQGLTMLEEAVLALTAEGEQRKRLLHVYFIWLAGMPLHLLPPCLRPAMVDIKMHFCCEEVGDIRNQSEATLRQLRRKLVKLYGEMSAWVALEQNRTERET